ncbi:MAG: EAL domain-containing protein (putative c-di-GMP-specific phosphodiesterase class I) [Glaciecola sp.]|jgi:EAL domain-containing protein (putative c-di-GMP-specific phosphodiesterase class I)
MDKILINEIDINEESLAIAKAVIALGTSLGMAFFAEGAETLAQANILGSLNCDTIQGFYFSKPAPFEQILRSKASC